MCGWVETYRYVHMPPMSLGRVLLVLMWWHMDKDGGTLTTVYFFLWMAIVTHLLKVNVYFGFICLVPSYSKFSPPPYMWRRQRPAGMGEHSTSGMWAGGCCVWGMQTVCPVCGMWVRQQIAVPIRAVRFLHLFTEEASGSRKKKRYLVFLI